MRWTHSNSCKAPQSSAPVRVMPQRPAVGAFGTSVQQNGHIPKAPSDEPLVDNKTYSSTRTHTNLFKETPSAVRPGVSRGGIPIDAHQSPPHKSRKYEILTASSRDAAVDEKFVSELRPAGQTGRRSHYTHYAGSNTENYSANDEDAERDANKQNTAKHERRNERAAGRKRPERVRERKRRDLEEKSNAKVEPRVQPDSENGDDDAKRSRSKPTSGDGSLMFKPGGRSHSRDRLSPEPPEQDASAKFRSNIAFAAEYVRRSTQP